MKKNEMQAKALWVQDGENVWRPDFWDNYYLVSKNGANKVVVPRDTPCKVLGEKKTREYVHRLIDFELEDGKHILAYIKDLPEWEV